MDLEWGTSTGKYVEELRGKYNFLKDDFYLVLKVKETCRPPFS